MLEKLRDTLERFGMIPRGETVVTAVSGGPDSVAMLHGLWRLREAGGFSLCVAHFDHRLRPESPQEGAWVRELAAALGVPFNLGEGRVRERASREGLSLQVAARKERYAFLGEVAQKYGATKVALGHTLDDQAETVLLRLVRGAGVDGLAAIRPVRADGVIRPILYVTREEILAYCRQEGLKFLLDPSNEKPVYLRNRLRLELLPLLARYNPQVKETLAKTAEELRADGELLAHLTQEAWGHLCLRRGKALVGLSRSGCRDEPLSLQRRILRRAMGIMGMEAGYAEVERLRGFLVAEGAEALPGGIMVWTEEDGLWLGRRLGQEGVPLMVPGLTPLPALGWGYKLSWWPGVPRGWQPPRTTGIRIWPIWMRRK